MATKKRGPLSYFDPRQLEALRSAVHDPALVRATGSPGAAFDAMVEPDWYIKIRGTYVDDTAGPNKASVYDVFRGGLFAGETPARVAARNRFLVTVKKAVTSPQAKPTANNRRSSKKMARR